MKGATEKSQFIDNWLSTFQTFSKNNNTEKNDIAISYPMLEFAFICTWTSLSIAWLNTCSGNCINLIPHFRVQRAVYIYYRFVIHWYTTPYRFCACCVRKHTCFSRASFHVGFWCYWLRYGVWDKLVRPGPPRTLRTWKFSASSKILRTQR